KLAGVFEHRELRSWCKLAVLLGVVFGSLAALAYLGAWSAWFLIPIASVFATAAAMLGHEGSHRSFSASPARNALLVYLVFPLFSGLGALYWKNKHDREHHAHPNVEGVDPDIKPFPFVSSRGDHEGSGPKARWFQRNCQSWLFWPMSTLMAIGMRRSSILYLARYPKKHERAWRIELACVIGHYTGWIVIPCILWGPAAFLLYVLLWAGVGVCLALVFAPAHMGLPIMRERNHEWQHQLETTRNLELPRFVSFFFVGLDYQVEHHLFPKIPHQNLPKAARITRAWCKQNGVTYKSEPYLSALADARRFMRDAWDRESITVAEVLELAAG
ncbi:MAG TPA: acyl-CoA desaturase, partial [Kofleriaceae bacterium]|nr:acyl-CoA desaturase [Kofleriaceae bacterium]